MSRGCGLMSMGRLIVKFSGAIVWALRHGVLLSQLDAISQGEELSAHPSAVHCEDSAGNVVAGR
jgi:hypothetical protein